MDIEKIKSDFEASECFKRFEHVVQYTFFLNLEHTSNVLMFQMPLKKKLEK